VRLNKEASSILRRARIGMLVLRSGRTPLVNPAAFSYTSGALWMTTSRFAAKTVMARRDPRAAFFVDGGARAVVLRGTMEVFDPISLTSQVRALLGGPGFYLGMADYTLKNAPFVAGYMLDLLRIPREWLPYNRVVLCLRPSEAELLDVIEFPEAQSARVPGVPVEIGRRLAGVTRGYACWLEGTKPVIEPALWEGDRGRITVAAAGSRHPRAGASGALVIESHHSYRPSLMVGVCLRGRFLGAMGREAIAERYGIELAGVPHARELQTERATAWRGFNVITSVPKGARHLRVAEG
jgi:hypothetical protein